MTYRAGILNGSWFVHPFGILPVGDLDHLFCAIEQDVSRADVTMDPTMLMNDLKCYDGRKLVSVRQVQGQLTYRRLLEPTSIEYPEGS